MSARSDDASSRLTQSGSASSSTNEPEPLPETRSKAVSVGTIRVTSVVRNNPPKRPTSSPALVFFWTHCSLTYPQKKHRKTKLGDKLLRMSGKKSRRSSQSQRNNGETIEIEKVFASRMVPRSCGTSVSQDQDQSASTILVAGPAKVGKNTFASVIASLDDNASSPSGTDLGLTFLEEVEDTPSIPSAKIVIRPWFDAFTITLPSRRAKFQFFIPDQADIEVLIYPSFSCFKRAGISEEL